MNKLYNYSVYLVGPIDFAPDSGKGWREKISKFLNNFDINIFNPCNKPLDMEEEDDGIRKKLHTLNENSTNEEYDDVSSFVKNIVTIYLHMLYLYTFNICYLHVDIPMCGTYSELTYAALEKKPVIVMCKQGKNKVPGWLWGILDHNLFFGNWEDVKDYIRDISLDRNVYDKRWRFIDYNRV